MKRIIRTFILLIVFIVGISIAEATGTVEKPRYAVLDEPPMGEVRLNDEFWAPRIKTCRDIVLPYCFETCETTGRIENFVKAAKKEGKFKGIWFNDSDVHKVIDGAAYSLRLHPDPKLDKMTDEVIAKIAAAQQDDGYLLCYFILGDASKRFEHIHKPARHELYTMGHLIEAGAVHYEMTGKRNFVDVAIKAADNVDSIFGPGKRMEVPEHQEMELALIRLYRVTGEKRYLNLAKHFIDQRGNAEGHKLYDYYSQDHKPVREQTEAVGHAVRAMYNCMGMLDLYAETGDEQLLAACKRIWQSATHRRMYVTGGVGAIRFGEAFGKDYELPNATAYAETCAQIGLIHFARRMFMIEPDGEYIDVMERTLYNAFLSGLSLSGNKFFYQNRLAAKGDYHRKPWYDCACCPSNIIRVYPRLGQFVYALGKSVVYVNLYAAGTGKISVDGKQVVLKQETRYPWDGSVVLTVTPPKPQKFDICLRIPGWCRENKTPGALYVGSESKAKPTLKINGKQVSLDKLEKGYARISREWKAGDKIELDLPMSIRRMQAHPEVKADAGRVALQRGPIVYCVEAADNGGRVSHLSLPADAKLTAEHRPNMLGGVTVIKGKVGRHDLLAVPYYAWDNRQSGEMAVWLKE
ncbi:MAG TPA: glycoside hydrolase family 127 protein [Pirellulales bacterium]|nr:glycoside hydrolase family 127 protein [Pirellulales bacterium]